MEEKHSLVLWRLTLILLAVALVGGVLSFALTTGSSGDGSAEGRKVSSKVVKIIQSYVGVVNKMVWRKDQ